jgi:pseudouridine kinase
MELIERLRGIQGHVVVIGGANTDIVGLSDAALVSGDSNPGHVRVSAGGVGRNIAENLARLGVPTSLITAFGGNPESSVLRNHCEGSAIDLEGSIMVADMPGPRYLAIADENGDMALALADMRALEYVTPGHLSVDPAALMIEEAAMIVVDSNPTPEALAHVFGEAEAPIVADSVSVAKAAKLTPHLSRLAAIKTNPLEAAALLGESCPEECSREDAERMGTALFEAGTKRVFLTLAEEGCVYVDSDGTGFVPPASGEVVDTTGAGDSFTAGVALGVLADLTSREVAALGSAIAAKTASVERSVHLEPDIEAISADADRMLA